MKLFLKPIAIFACIALLFCACGEDDTVDASGYSTAPVTLDEPVDVTVASGNGRAAVTWRVPDDSNITHAMVQWDNATEESSATMNEIDRVEVIPTQKKTYEIGQAGDADPEFPTAGDYNFTVTLLTVNSAGIIVGRSNQVPVTKYIYNYSTYESSRPNPYNIKTEGDSKAVISWSRFHDEFLAVKLFYINTDDEEDETERLEINSNAATTTLLNAKFDENFSFYSYFKPSDGLDTIAIAPSETALNLSSSAASPTNVSILPGIGRMRLQWMVPSNEDIISTVVKYQYLGDTSGEYDENNSIISYAGDPVYIQYGGTEITKYDLSDVFYGEDNTNASIFYYTEDVLINNRNERFICGDYAIPSGNSDDEVGGNYISTRLTTHLTAGYYEVKVYNIKLNGAISSPTEDDETIQTIHVYDETNTFVAPTLSGVPIRTADGVVTFDFVEDLSRWNNGTAACSGVTIFYYTDDDAYEGGAGTPSGEHFASLADLASVGLTGAQVETTFTYESHFEPSGTFDPLTIDKVSDDNTFIPDVAPNAPKSVTTTPSTVSVGDYGNYENQIPLINVAWIPADDEDGISAYRVYWYSSEAGATTYRSDYIDASTLTLNSDGAYEYTITENLVANTKYSVEVASASGEISGLSGRTESDRTGVVVMPTAYGYDTYKDVVLSYSAVKNNGDSASIMWSSFDVDCIGVAAYYYNSSEGKTMRYPEDTNEYSEVSASSLSTPLADALTGSDFSYIAYYVPTEGIVPVKVKWVDATETEEGTQVGTIPNPVPVPAGLTLASSYEIVWDDDAGTTIVGYTCQIKATWSDLVDAERIVDKMYIRYYSDGGEVVDTRIGVTATEYTLPPTGKTLEAGVAYTVQIVTEDTGAQDSDGNNLTSESDPVVAFAYDADTYSSADFPIGIGTVKDGVVYIKWSNIQDDLKGVYITYGEGNAEDRTDGTEMIAASELKASSTSFDYQEGVTEFTFTAAFLPEGGSVDIPIEGGYGMITSGSTSTDDSDYYYDEATGKWLIYTAEGLQYIATYVNSASANSGITISLQNDINLAELYNASADGDSWPGIGISSSLPFNGTFEGNGHTVGGVYISATAANKGFFYYTGSSAVIKDLILQNPTIVSTSTHAGGLVGYVNGSTIENCHIQGSRGMVSGTNNIGGLVGLASEANIIGCTNEGYVYGSGTSTGGIAGYITGAKISCCVNYGEVESVGRYTGGIVGTSYGVSYVQICNNAGYVHSTSTETGGIVGYAYNTGPYLIYCANEDEAVVEGAGSTGGIIGCNGGVSFTDGATNYVAASGGYTAAELLAYTMKLVTKTSPLGGNYNKGTVTGSSAGSTGGIVGDNDAVSSAYIDPYGEGDTYRVWNYNNYYTMKNDAGTKVGGAITGTSALAVSSGTNNNVDYSETDTVE